MFRRLFRFKFRLPGSRLPVGHFSVFIRNSRLSFSVMNLNQDYGRYQRLELFFRRQTLHFRLDRPLYLKYPTRRS